MKAMRLFCGEPPQCGMASSALHLEQEMVVRSYHTFTLRPTTSEGMCHKGSLFAWPAPRV